jgi:hypothetical protein
LAKIDWVDDKLASVIRELGASVSFYWRACGPFAALHTHQPMYKNLSTQ